MSGAALGQLAAAPGCVVWFTGLPGSGKSTLAAAVRRALLDRTRPVALLDGDEVRAALVPAPGYDPRARDAFYATLARLAALLASQGLVVLVAATAHARHYRAAARTLCPRFVEVHVATPLDECRRRDPKGLYAAGGQAGATVPGVGVAYEPPLAPEVTAPFGLHPDGVAACLRAIEALG